MSEYMNKQIHKVVDMHTISLSLSPLVSTASRTVNVLVTTELCLEPSRDVATALIVTYAISHPDSHITFLTVQTLAIPFPG